MFKLKKPGVCQYLLGEFLQLEELRTHTRCSNYHLDTWYHATTKTPQLSFRSLNCMEMCEMAAKENNISKVKNPAVLLFIYLLTRRISHEVSRFCLYLIIRQKALFK